MKFNVNESVRVRLTPTGRAIHYAHWHELHERYPQALPKYIPPAEDSEGWSSWQLWSLMQTFGPHISQGSDMPFETEIEIPG